MSGSTVQGASLRTSASFYVHSLLDATVRRYGPATRNALSSCIATFVYSCLTTVVMRRTHSDENRSLAFRGQVHVALQRAVSIDASNTAPMKRRLVNSGPSLAKEAKERRNRRIRRNRRNKNQFLRRNRKRYIDKEAETLKLSNEKRRVSVRSYSVSRSKCRAPNFG